MNEISIGKHVCHIPVTDPITFSVICVVVVYIKFTGT